MPNHGYCKGYLRQARIDAREARVHVPSPFVAWDDEARRYPGGWHQVTGPGGHIIWQGEACCRWFARGEAVYALIDKAQAPPPDEATANVRIYVKIGTHPAEWRKTIGRSAPKVGDVFKLQPKQRYEKAELVCCTDTSDLGDAVLYFVERF